MANQQIERRRTFAIIAHPDAGKTSLTEKIRLDGDREAARNIRVDVGDGV